MSYCTELVAESDCDISAPLAIASSPESSTGAVGEAILEDETEEEEEYIATTPPGWYQDRMQKVPGGRRDTH